MPYVKCTALFELVTGTETRSGISRPRTGGWSESWYYSGDVPQARAAFRRVCTRRAALLSPGGKIVGQRYQRADPVARPSQMISFSPARAAPLTCPRWRFGARSLAAVIPTSGGSR